MRKAKDEAANRAGSSGSSDMFSSIISSLGQKKDLDKEDIDEEGEFSFFLFSLLLEKGL